MHDVLDPLKNPVTYAVPFFLLTILIELAALRWLDHDRRSRAGRSPATAPRMPRTSIAMGLGSLVSTPGAQGRARSSSTTPVFVYVAPLRLADRLLVVLGARWSSARPRLLLARTGSCTG